MQKLVQDKIDLLEGLGVAEDAHMGERVKHRSRVAKDPTQPNLRQVHLIHSELFDELTAKGIAVLPGQMGENITTRGIDLLALSKDSILQIGQQVRLRVTGLRNPCHQLDGIQQGLMQAVLDRDTNDNLIRKAGIMAVVVRAGQVAAGDMIRIIARPIVHQALERV